jgi:hypothetical protein
MRLIEFGLSGRRSEITEFSNCERGDGNTRIGGRRSLNAENGPGAISALLRGDIMDHRVGNAIRFGAFGGKTE